MPALPRPLAWMPWAAVLAVTIAVAVWQWTSWVNETEAEALRARERERSLVAAQAREEAARAQAYEAVIRATMRQQEVRPAEDRTEPKPDKPVRKAAEARRAPLPPTATALNCQRLRAAYTPDELAAMPAFQQACR